ARFDKWATISIHLGAGESAKDQFRQQYLDEGILVENHALTLVGAQVTKDRRPAWRQVLPVARPDHRFHVSDRAHAFGVPRCPVKSERGSPIVQYQRHLATQIECLE